MFMDARPPFSGWIDREKRMLKKNCERWLFPRRTGVLPDRSEVRRKRKHEEEASKSQKMDHGKKEELSICMHKVEAHFIFTK